MPGDLHTGTIGMLACLGVVGSAIMPFVTGAIANEVCRVCTPSRDPYHVILQYERPAVRHVAACHSVNEHS
jgi:hypothetical protein